MGKTAGRRLKVFRAHLGFYDTVVAAPSQAAALRAWGTHQNLFADGQARLADDPQAVAAALAHPRVPLMRAIGSIDPFALEPAHLPSMPDAPKTAKSKPKAKAKPEAPRKPPADRSALDGAEAALRRVDDDRKQEKAALSGRQAELDAEREGAQTAYAQRRKSAVASIAKAREAYRKAGGED